MMRRRDVQQADPVVGEKADDGQQPQQPENDAEGGQGGAVHRAAGRVLEPVEVPERAGWRGQSQFICQHQGPFCFSYATEEMPRAIISGMAGQIKREDDTGGTRQAGEAAGVRGRPGQGAVQGKGERRFRVPAGAGEALRARLQGRAGKIGPVMGGNCPIRGIDRAGKRG